MKKLIALLLVLVLALSLVACGEAAAPAADPTPAGDTTPTDGETGDETTDAEDSLFNHIEMYAAEEVAGTGWTFAGGYVNGNYMTQEEADSTLANVYGGTLAVVFPEEGVVNLVQGSGAVEGTYVINDDATISITFENYPSFVAAFTVVDEQAVLVLVPDGVGMNGIFFTQITEG